MKVVINNQYGGFGLSNEAVKQLALRGAECLRVMTLKEYYGGREDWEERWLKDKQDLVDMGDGFWGHKWGFDVYKEGYIYMFDDNRNNRADPTLVEVVKDLKARANGEYAALKVVNIPKDIEWTVEDYDGFEWIAETHRTWQ